MKAVLPRIERLYESEAERWHAAWKRFDEELWRPLSSQELQDFLDACDAPAAWLEAMAVIIRAWNQEAGGDGDETEWAAFLAAFDEAVPQSDEVDLSRWPHLMPVPPPDTPEMWQIARRDASKGEPERLAAGWVLYQLATGRAARLYSQEAR